MATYTPTTNPNPVFGQSGPSVTALQNQLNQQHANQPGYVPLTVDGLFGPKTQEAVNFKPQPGIVSTTGMWNTYHGLNKDLNTFEIAGDPYNQMFNRLLESNRAAEATAIANATAETARAKQGAEQDRAAAISGLESSGESSGRSRYLPGYQAGLLSNAKEAFNKKFQLLDYQEKLAIARAKEARSNADLKVAAEQLDYAKQLRKEKADALEAAQKMEWEKYKFETTMALRRQTSGSGGKYNKKNIPSDIQNDILDDLADSNVNLLDLYQNYPEVDPSYLESLYDSVHTGSTITNPFAE